MKIFSQAEATVLLRNNPILYAELAHDYPCCNIPQIENCKACCKPKECPISKETE